MLVEFIPWLSWCLVELVRHFKIFRTKYFSFGSFLYDSSDHIYRSKNGENSLFSAISKFTYNANFDFSVRQITLGQKFSSSLIFTKSKFYSLTREKMRRCRRRWAWAINLFFASPFHSAFVWFFPVFSSLPLCLCISASKKESLPLVAQNYAWNTAENLIV